MHQEILSPAQNDLLPSKTLLKYILKNYYCERVTINCLLVTAHCLLKIPNNHNNKNINQIN